MLATPRCRADVLSTLSGQWQSSDSAPSFAAVVEQLQDCVEWLQESESAAPADLLTEAALQVNVHAAQLLLAAAPSLATTQDSNGQLPLHKEARSRLRPVGARTAGSSTADSYYSH